MKLHTFVINNSTPRKVSIQLETRYGVSLEVEPDRCSLRGGASLRVTSVEQCDALILSLCEAKRLLTDPGYLSVTEAERIALDTWRESEPVTPSAPGVRPSLQVPATSESAGRIYFPALNGGGK